MKPDSSEKSGGGLTVSSIDPPNSATSRSDLPKISKMQMDIRISESVFARFRSRMGENNDVVELQGIFSDNLPSPGYRERPALREWKDEGSLGGPDSKNRLYDCLREAERLASEQRPELVPEIQKLLAIAEVTGHAVAPLPALNDADLASFRAKAKDRSWLKRRAFGYSREISPVEFIQREYAYWIERGLTRAQLRAANRDLGKRLDNWLLEPGNKLPPGILPVRGAATELAAKVLAPEVVAAAARVAKRDQSRRLRRPALT